MVDKPAKCPKCDGTMEEGFPSGHLFGWVVAPWKGSWLKRVVFWPKSVRGLRCKVCGYLELYTKP